MSRCRHKWEWTELKITYPDGYSHNVTYTNAICTKCGKRKWGHGRNPHMRMT